MNYKETKESYQEKIKKERTEFDWMVFLYKYHVKSIMIYVATFVIEVTLMLGVASFSWVLACVESLVLWYISLSLIDKIRFYDAAMISAQASHISYLISESYQAKDEAWAHDKQSV